MTRHEFGHILECINALSPDQARRLYRELQSKMASPSGGDVPLSAGEPDGAPEESAFDVFSRTGLIGCVPGSPDDLSTNPAHMGGFGNGEPK